MNSIGCCQHMINPGNKEPNAFDGPIVKYFIDRNNERYQEYYDNLSSQKR